jgi:GAF domain-containing protein
VLSVAKTSLPHHASTGLLSGIPHGVLVGLIIAVILGLIQWPFRRFLGPSAKRKLQDRRDTRRAQKFAPLQLELALAFLTHLRDGVLPAVWRVHAAPDEVRAHVRRNILEPIRGVVATMPGEQIKVVWFRPDAEGAHLLMHEQVGHTPEGQAAMRLPIGSGIAGAAFTSEETVYCPDCSDDARFRDLPQGHRQGSIVCVPIKRGGDVTGVLSVWSTWENAFWLGDTLYFEALAAAIASLEVFEQEPERAV